MEGEKELFQFLRVFRLVELLVNQKIITVVTVIAAENVFHVQYLEGDASGCDDNGE